MFNDPIEANDLNKDSAIKSIGKFEANMNGTNILDPIKKAFNMKISKDKNGEDVPKRIFMLTDGCVNNEYEIIEYIKRNAPASSKVYTYGVGNGCSRVLCE